MAFFDEAQKALDEGIRQVNDPNVTDEQKEEAADLADEVLQAAEDMGGEIPGDISNQLMGKARVIKNKLASE